jgi:hypothetical protein
LQHVYHHHHHHHDGREASQTQAPSPNGVAMDVMDFVEPPFLHTAVTVATVAPATAAAAGYSSSFLPKRVLFPQDFQHAHEMTNASRRLLFQPTTTTIATTATATATTTATNNMPRDLMEVLPRSCSFCSLTDVDMDLLDYIQEFQPRRALEFLDDAPVHHHHHPFEASSANKNNSINTTTTTLMHPGAPFPTMTTTAAGAVATKMLVQVPNPMLAHQPDFGLHMNHHHQPRPFELPHDEGISVHPHGLDAFFDNDA